jgi:hypothetical protein
MLWCKELYGLSEEEIAMWKIVTIDIINDKFCHNTLDKKEPHNFLFMDL